MVTKEKISKYLTSYVKFQGIPFAFVGFIFSLLTILTKLSLILVPIDVFQVAMDPLFVIFVGIGTYLYIERFYRDNLVCNCHVGWMKKVHYFGAIGTGVYATGSVFFLHMLLLFIFTINTQSGNVLDALTGDVFGIELPVLWILPACFFGITFISSQIFVSYDGKSSFLYNQEKHPWILVKEFLSKTS